MQLSRDYAVTRRITFKLNITLYSKSLNPTLHISPPSSVGGALCLKSKGRWFEPAVNHFFSNNIRLFASRSLQVKTNSQNDWSVTNQIGYTGLRQDSYLEFICRLFLSLRCSFKHVNLILSFCQNTIERFHVMTLYLDWYFRIMWVVHVHTAFDVYFCHLYHPLSLAEKYLSAKTPVLRCSVSSPRRISC